MPNPNNNDNNIHIHEAITSVVEIPTCLNEGYTEHTCSCGYVWRDTITAKTDHYNIVEETYTLSTEIGYIKETCIYCGLETITYKTTEAEIDFNRERPSFVNHDTMAVAIIKEQTIADAIIAIKKAEANGAMGFDLHISFLDDEIRNVESLKQIIYSTEKPILALCYNSGYLTSHNYTQKQRLDWLLMAVEAGCAAVDLQGFMYDDNTKGGHNLWRQNWENKGYDMSFLNKNPGEVTVKPGSIEDQQSFIETVHLAGAEVLLSIHSGVDFNENEIIALFKFIEGTRNIDIIKLVTAGSTNGNQTVIELIKATIRAKTEINCKFVVQASGQGAILSRLICPMFGSYVSFCVDEFNMVQDNNQIALQTMINILNSPEVKELLQ